MNDRVKKIWKKALAHKKFSKLHVQTKKFEQKALPFCK